MGRVELLALVGTSAAVICPVQAAVLEHRDWARISFTWQVRHVCLQSSYLLLLLLLTKSTCRRTACDTQD